MPYLNGVVRWDDDNNRDGVRPDEVAIEFHINNKKEVEAIAASNNPKSNEWGFRLESDARLDKGDAFEVKPQDIFGYNLSNVSSAGGVVTYTYKHEIDKVDVNVTVKWDDNNNAAKKRPDDVVVKLFNENNKENVIEKNVKAGDKPEAGAVFNNQFINEAGKTIKYKAEQGDISGFGYETEVKSIDDYGHNIVITNKYVGDQEKPKQDDDVKPEDNGENKSNPDNNVKPNPEKQNPDNKVKLGQKNEKPGNNVKPNPDMSKQNNKKQDTKTTVRENKAPKTGDTSKMFIYGGVLLIAVVIFVVISKKKKNK